MDDCENDESVTETYWSQLLLMGFAATGVFGSIEYIPTILSGAAGVVVSVIVASVFLYSFGRVTGRMVAGSTA